MAYDADLADRLRECLRECLREETGLTERRMFGGLAFLVNGRLTVSASGQGGLLLRVDPVQTEALVKRKHAERFVMRGRPMDGWLHIGVDGIRTHRDLARWVSLGTDYVRSLPDR